MTWTAVAAGGSHSLAIRDGMLFSFGANANGRTGLNTISGETIVPTQVGTDADWTAVAAGGSHSLAIRNGMLFSFGWNDSARTGLNTAGGDTLVPTQVGAATDWTAISAGIWHSLAIRGGMLFSFGLNSWGATGLNTTISSTAVPTQVGTATDWTAVAAGSSHSLAIRNGMLFSFGWNDSARTGLNTIFNNTLIPTQVGAATDWTAVAAGSSHSLAIRNGMLFSFGSNSNGRTGLNTTSGNTLVPTQVGAATDWTAVAAGEFHSLAIRDGMLFSFGSNSSGRAGQGTISGNTLVPTQVGTDTGWTAVSAGNSHSLAIRDGLPLSFGSDANSRLGLGTINERLEFTSVAEAYSSGPVSEPAVYSTYTPASLLYIPEFPNQISTTPTLSTTQVAVGTNDIAVVLEAPRTGVLDKISVRLGTVSGASGSVSVSRSSDGFPGNSLSSATFSLSANATVEITLSVPLAVTEGELLSFRFSSVSSSTFQIIGFTDAGLFGTSSFLTNASGSWVIIANQGPCMALSISGVYGPTQGLWPIHGTSTTNISTSTAIKGIGNRFTLDGAVRVTGFWLWADIEDHCQLRLYDETEVISTLLVVDDYPQGTVGRLSFHKLAHPIILSANVEYTLAVVPSTTTQSTIYDLTIRDYLLPSAPGRGNWFEVSTGTVNSIDPADYSTTASGGSTSLFTCGIVVDQVLLQDASSGGGVPLIGPGGLVY